MTRLGMPLKRELLIKGQPYRLTISQLGLHLALKGRRKGYELSWLDFVNGDAALATALNATLAANRKEPPAGTVGPGPRRARRKSRG
jgi:hypothetical protein